MSGELFQENKTYFYLFIIFLASVLPRVRRREKEQLKEVI